jgi:hypothetical protein
MSQVSYKIRMRTYRELHLDGAAWTTAKTNIANGKRVSGVLKLVNPVSSVMALATAAHVAAGNEVSADGLQPGAVTSFRNGLLDDIGLLLAQTSVVKENGKETTGEVWFAAKIAASKGKLHFRDFEKSLDALAKADKKAVVHRGMKWELADCLVNYSTGKKGKAKKSILRTIDEI